MGSRPDVCGMIGPDHAIDDDIDFDRWENGVLCLKAERELEEICLAIRQLCGAQYLVCGG